MAIEPHRVSAEEFVKVWQTSQTAADVADKLNLTLQVVYARAAYMKKKGVKLKLLKKAGRRAIDVSALNKIAAEHQP